MALVNRISKLIKADFHAVLDQIEEPEQLLRQAIRDMEDDLADSGQRIALHAREQAALALRKGDLENSQIEVAAQLDLCFASQKDDLARALLRRKLEAERLLQRLNAMQTANQQHLDAQQAKLGENRATLDSLRQKAELFAQHTGSSRDDDSTLEDFAWTAREMSVGDDEVEIAYLREKSARQSS